MPTEAVVEKRVFLKVVIDYVHVRCTTGATSLYPRGGFRGGVVAVCIGRPPPPPT